MDMSRREFLGQSVRLFLAGFLPGVVGCSPLEPKEFKLGQIVRPPLGCEQLREQNEEGDC